MDKYQETFDTWNKMAKKYEDQFMDLELYNDTYDIFCDTLEKPDASVLDVGCGPGNTSIYLLKRNPELKITGIDVSQQMIKRAKHHLSMATFQVMDCRELHLLNKKYEGIICGFVLPYLSLMDCRKLFSDCSQLLETNGALYLSFVPATSQLSKILTGENGERMHFYCHTIENIKQKLESNQFRNFQIYHKVYQKRDQNKEIHTVIIAKKRD